MKSTISILLTLFFTSLCYSQTDRNVTGKFYITNVDIVVNEYDYINKSKKEDKYIVLAGTKFTAMEIDTVNNGVIIKFWYFTEKGDQIQKGTESIDSTQNYISRETNGKYFLINTQVLNDSTSDYYGKDNNFVWGFTIVPFKLRFGGENRSFKYQTSFSMGVNAGWEHQLKRKHRQSYAILVGIAVTNVEVSPETTDNFINQSTTAGAFTPSIGAVYSYEQFQAGIFVGYDLIPGELGKKWIYGDSPWVGIGLGFSIFQKNKTASNVEVENNQ